MKSKIVIFGDTSFAEIANQYFQREGHTVVAHIVDPGHKTRNEIFDVPVLEIKYEDYEKLKKLATHFYVASTYTKLNRLRSRKYLDLRNLGLIPMSYISPDAWIDPTVKLGEHLFIFENNTIQFKSTIGDNVVIWSGNHVGHHSQIGNDVFISSQVVISGHCEVRTGTFLGVNSTVFNNVTIGEFSWISPGSIIRKNLMDKSLTYPLKTSVDSKNTDEFFKIEQ